MCHVEGVTWERAKGSFVAMRELIKRHSIHKTWNQCKIKSRFFNIIRYGRDSTGHTNTTDIIFANWAT